MNVEPVPSQSETRELFFAELTASFLLLFRDALVLVAAESGHGHL